jgi:hypothetical protein
MLTSKRTNRFRFPAQIPGTLLQYSITIPEAKRRLVGEDKTRLVSLYTFAEKMQQNKNSIKITH